MSKEVELYGSLINAEYMDSEKLLKKKVKYVGTDFEFSGYDLYEDGAGKIYCTKS